MTTITQIELDRVAFESGDTLFGVYARHSDGLARWEKDYRHYADALHFAAGMAHNYSVNLLDTTNTGLIRYGDEKEPHA